MLNKTNYNFPISPVYVAQGGQQSTADKVGTYYCNGDRFSGYKVLCLHHDVVVKQRTHNNKTIQLSLKEKKMYCYKANQVLQLDHACQT